MHPILIIRTIFPLPFVVTTLILIILTKINSFMLSKKLSIFSAILFFATLLHGQDPMPKAIKRESIFNVGLGVSKVVLYDESFSMVRQEGLGPSVWLSFRHERLKLIHLVENSLALQKFHSDVSNPNYALSGENLHEKFNYSLLYKLFEKKIHLAAGASFCFDFNQLKPEGLAINNSPLHDFNLQIQLSSRATFPFNLFNRNFKLSYQPSLMLIGYNSRPDYLGFTEFSGDSKYFNKNANLSFVVRDYFYFNQQVQLAMNYANKNSFAVHYNWYYAGNQFYKPYQNSTTAFIISYSRMF